jgi:proline iminopeptidase
MEYALRFQQHLAGLIISNMMASIPAYNQYAQTVLMPDMDQAVLAEIKQMEVDGQYESPRYMELLIPHYYVHHILRMPHDQWPDPVHRAFKHINPAIYVPLQGPSELGASGKLLHWDRTAELANIAVPTLVIGARYDTMDPDHLAWMADTLPKGQFLFCPQGSHLAMYDDQHVYFDGLAGFIRDVAGGRSSSTDHARDTAASRTGLASYRP